MATAVVPNLDRLAERRAYVDAGRFAAVVGDFYDGTPVADAARAVPDLASDLPDLTLRGDRLTVTAESLQKGARRQPRRDLEVVYVDNDDARAVRRSSTCPCDRTGARVTRSVRLRGCADGCQLAGMAVTRLFGERSGVFTFDTTPMTVLLERDRGRRPGPAPTSPGSPTRRPSASNQSNRVPARRRRPAAAASRPTGPTGWRSRRSPTVRPASS